MSGRITRDEVLHVAKLARLALTEAEIDALTGELDKILEKGAAVEMQQRAPTAQPHQPHPATAGYGERGERGEHGERGEYGEHGGRGYGYRRKSWLAEIFD